MGRSRGGLTSKIHALVDAKGRPVTLRLTAGQVADCREAEALIETLGEGDNRLPYVDQKEFLKPELLLNKHAKRLREVLEPI